MYLSSRRAVSSSSPPRTSCSALTSEAHRLTSCYHDGMSRKATTVRLPEDLADQVEVVARGRGVSVNAVVVDALVAEVERVRADKQFMAQLRKVTERDKEILDRLAK